MYLNKLLILKKLQQANTHLGLTIGRPGTRWSRFSAQRAQSYIFGFRAAQPIIDLDKTVISLRRACNVIQLITRSNGHLLFVNTNPKYNKIIQQTAKCTNQSFINHKWIGGFLTNWNHMRNVQQQFHEAARFTRVFLKEGSKTKVAIGPNSPFARPTRYPQPPKRRPPIDGWTPPKGLTSGFDGAASAAVLSQAARSNDTRKNLAENNLAVILTNPRYKKMQKCFEGLRKLSQSASKSVADCIIIFNANQNSTAIYEAHLNQIPIICVVDSNIPNELYNLITYPIPANSESVQFIYLFCNCILKTILVSR